MPSLPSDRTKLTSAQGNQNPSIVASSAKNIGAITETYDTIDLLYQTLQTYQAGTRYNADGGAFTDGTATTVIDGGTFL
jgi:hypothetical protein